MAGAVQEVEGCRVGAWKEQGSSRSRGGRGQEQSVTEQSRAERGEELGRAGKVQSRSLEGAGQEYGRGRAEAGTVKEQGRSRAGAGAAQKQGWSRRVARRELSTNQI